MTEGKRTFPLQRPLSSSDTKPGPRMIPWEIAERAYAEYAKRYGTSQSLERLAERGGFDVGEMDMLLPSWRNEVDVFHKLVRERDEARTSLTKLREALATSSTSEENALRARLEAVSPLVMCAKMHGHMGACCWMLFDAEAKRLGNHIMCAMKP
jgi:hypothetical protein